MTALILLSMKFRLNQLFHIVGKNKMYNIMEKYIYFINVNRTCSF